MGKRIVRLRFGKWLADRVSKVYNPLNKLVRRMKMAKITVLATSGTALLVVSLTLLLAPYDEAYSPRFIIGVILAVFALALWYTAINSAKQEDDRREKQMQALVRELKGFRKDTKNRDKRIKGRPKRGSKSNGNRVQT